MKRRFPAFILILSLVAAPLAAAVQLVAPTAETDGVFPLVSQQSTASIVIPANAPELVKIVARDFAEDVSRVSGKRPPILDTPPADTSLPVVRLLFSEALTGKWETFQISANNKELTVAGSDARALAYGLFELSRRIGVSPWYWWDDVPVSHHAELLLSTDTEPVDQPAVKYRGIFLNDEDWGLQPWAAKTFEPEVGDIGPKTYGKIFELMLRLRANTIWPAMHPSTKAFFQIPGNAETADRYGIVVGSSHAEPMLRNNVGEWTADKSLYNYATNREGVLNYWEDRVKARTSGESLFTLGMRGVHDSAIVGFKNQTDRITALENIFADQRALLAKYLGQGDPTRVGQIFCPYKEVLDDYNAGLKVPDDVTIVWPDDNFGYIRRFATEAERRRSGGLGIYYHLSYLGAPFSWIWIDSMPTALIWTEMTKAYEQGARSVWIANVGDLKNTELSAEFFLDLAWHADRTSPQAPTQYLHSVAARDFGSDQAAKIADIWTRHQLLAAARKPEHLQWSLPQANYQPTTLTEQEMHSRLDAYTSLVGEVDAVATKLPADMQDAFFERVAYPVKIAAAANERYFRAELARLEKARGQEESAREIFSLSEAADARIDQLDQNYNENIGNGKWRHIVRRNGMGTDSWLPRFQPDPKIPPLDSDAQNAVHVPAPLPPSQAPVIPPNIHPGEFIERDGVVSINAGHFNASYDLPTGEGWRSVPGLGRTGSAVTVLPSTTNLSSGNAPRLSYRFYVGETAPAKLHVRLLPTFPIIPDQGLRLALSIDQGPVLPTAVTTGFDPKKNDWKQRVLTNATETTVTWPEPLISGWHTLDLVAVDTGVIVDKIVIDLGGLNPSYDGPPETRIE